MSTEEKKVVLVVEDSKLLRTVLHESLSEGGFTVYEADNGLLGLETARSIHPNLIMLDVMMPVMDGLEMYRKLRDEEWGKDIPVIMLTGAEEERVTSWISQNGLDFFKKDGWMMDEVVAKAKSKLGIA